MEESKEKIDSIRAELARQTSTPVDEWWPIPGYVAITNFEKKEGQAVFNPSSGIPLKAFLNTRTGEVRTILMVAVLPDQKPES